MDEFEMIYQLYFKDVFRYALGLTKDTVLAEEITEETFFKAMRSLDTFRGECELRVWLCRIAKNYWLNEQKKRGYYTDDNTVLDKIVSNTDIVTKLVDSDMAFQLHKFLHTLEEPYKEVFSLRIFGELSFKQIGALFEKNDHWACITYHRAKEKIQKKLGGI